MGLGLGLGLGYGLGLGLGYGLALTLTLTSAHLRAPHLDLRHLLLGEGERAPRLLRLLPRLARIRARLRARLRLRVRVRVRVRVSLLRLLARLRVGAGRSGRCHGRDGRRQCNGRRGGGGWSRGGLRQDRRAALADDERLQGRNGLGFGLGLGLGLGFGFGFGFGSGLGAASTASRPPPWWTPVMAHHQSLCLKSAALRSDSLGRGLPPTW